MTPALAVALSAAFSVLAYAVMRWGSHEEVSPDGAVYGAMAEGARVPMPYQRRWLVPSLCGPRQWAWTAATGASLIALPVLLTVWLLQRDSDPWGAFAGAVLFAGIPGVFRFNVQRPILVDAPSMAFALLSVVLWPVSPVLSLGAALISGACKETGPVFAACWSLNPWLLIGILGSGWMLKTGPLPEAADILGAGEPLEKPWKTARSRHRRNGVFSPTYMLLPWGVLVVLAPLGAGLEMVTVAAGVSLAVGYGQMVRAMDSARLYQWAAPAVILVALAAPVPAEILTLACVLHWFNPWTGV